MKLQKIGFIGLGLIGGSIAKRLRILHKDLVIIATAGHAATIEAAYKEGLTDNASPCELSDFYDCDYIFLCTPVQKNMEYLRLLKGHVCDRCIITDVGSVKTDIHREVTALGMEAQFIGGHPMAAGLSLREDVAVFRGKINACCELTEEDFIPKIRIDMAMPAAYPTIGLIRELARLEPFGNGNSKPQFADRELALLRASVVGRNQNVLKLSLMTAAGEHVSAVYFGDVEAWKQYYSEKYGQTEVDAALRGRANAIRMSVIYYPEINVYQGMESVQLIIRNYK